VKNYLGYVIDAEAEIKSTWKEHYNYLINVEFDRDWDGLASAELFRDLHP